MKKSRNKLLLYGLVMLLVLALTGAAWAAPADTKSNEQKSAETQPASVFKDVQAGDSNLIYINYLAKRDIISGFPDGGFRPAEGLTRAQAATLLVKAAGLSSSEKKAVFKDVYAGHWAAGSIAAAAGAGYLKGYPDGTYHPEEQLSRAQGISLVLRLSKQKDTGVELPALKDLDSKHWAARSVAIGLAAGMVGLTSDKTQFLPDTDFSRGDLSRALAVLLTTDPDLSQASLDGSLEIKKGEVKVNDKTVTGTISVKVGDLITTSAGAEAQLSYPDGSSLLIKENTKITVKETRGRAYIKKDGSPGTAVDFLLVNLKEGNVFGALATNPNAMEEESEKKTANLKEKLLAGISGALEYLAAGDKEAPWYKTAEAKKVKVKVDMPYGVAAIRGSFWNNFVNQNGTGTTSLLEGSAEISAGGQTQPLPPGQSSTLTQSNQPPPPPVPMTPAQVTSWTQQGAWLQTVAQNMQQNQAAPRTEAGITQTFQGPVPGQPGQQSPLTPPVPPPPAPPVPDILNLVTQALNQAQQNAGLPVAPPGSQLPLGYNPIGGGGGTTTTEDSSPSPSSVLARLANSPAYLQVNSITVSGTSLSLSGKTYPNNSVRLGGGLLQNAPPISTADAYGNFSFSSIAINSNVLAPNNCLVLDQLLDSTGASGSKASLCIPNALDSPSLPAMIEINRGLYTDSSTSVLITGKMLPAQNQNVSIYRFGGNEHWSGTVSATGAFSIDIGVQPPGTQLGVEIGPATPDGINGGGHTYIYAANAVGVMATMPQNDVPLASDILNTVQVFFDRNVALVQGSSINSITMSPSGSFTAVPSISGSVLTINITGTLAANTRYTVSIPAGVIQDANNPAVTVPEFSFSFTTGSSGGGTVTPITVPIPTGTGYVCTTSNQPSGGATFSYNDISTSHDNYDRLYDDTSILQDIGFSFSFYGTSYTQVHIGTNGYLTFGTGDSTWTNYSFPANGYPRIAPFFDDLMPNLQGSGIYRKLEGTSPNRKLIIQWRLQDHYYSSPNTVDFQVILHEGSNNILFQYLDTTFGDYNDHGNSATVGLNKGDGVNALQYSYNIPAITDALAILFTPTSNMPRIQSVTDTPNPIPFSSSDQSVNVAIACSDLADGTQVTVQLYSMGATPTPVGNPVNASISSNAATAVLTVPAGTPEGSYIIRVSGTGFSNYDSPFQITNWTCLVTDGTATFQGANLNSNTALAGDSANGVYAAYTNASGNPMVKKYNGGTSWTSVDYPSAVTSDNKADLAMTSGGDAYLAYLNGSSEPTVMSMVYNSSTWTDLGTISSDTADRLSLTTCSSNPYLSYSTTNSIQTYVYDCGSWTSLGSINSPAGDISLAWHAYMSKPYLAYRNGNSVGAYVYNTGSGWSGALAATTAAANSPVSLAYNSYTHYLYLAYRDSTDNVMLKMYDNSSWSDVGPASGSKAAGSSTASSISVDSASTTAYVVYSDATADGRATVKYFNGSIWTPLGSPGFTPTAVTEPRIKIIGSDVYVIYKDDVNNIQVMKRTL